MRASLPKNADTVIGIAKCDEVFAQEAQADRIAIRSRQLFRDQGRNPKAAKQLARRRAGPDTGQRIVVFQTQHAHSPLFTTFRD